MTQLDQSFAARAFTTYAALHTMAARASWQPAEDGGGLLSGLFAAASLSGGQPEFPLAASIAGAASLSVPEGPADGREMLRRGLCDFVVTSLDEALRILKNELRKRQPVSVCVLEDMAKVSEEMKERGVAPDLLIDTADSVHHRWPQQAAVRAGGVRGNFADPSLVLPWTGTEVVSWRGPRELLRELVLGTLPADDHLRRRWVQASGRFLPRALAPLPVCALFPKERDMLIASVSSRLMVGELQDTVEIDFAGERIRLG